MGKAEEPKDYRAALAAERLAMRWKSDDGDRQFHREYIMPKSPRATSNDTNKGTNYETNSNSGSKSGSGRRWPF